MYPYSNSSKSLSFSQNLNAACACKHSKHHVLHILNIESMTVQSSPSAHSHWVVRLSASKPFIFSCNFYVCGSLLTAIGFSRGCPCDHAMTPTILAIPRNHVRAVGKRRSSRKVTVDQSHDAAALNGTGLRRNESQDKSMLRTAISTEASGLQFRQSTVKFQSRACEL